MGNAGNVMLLLMPPELMGPVVMLLLVLGGLAITLGARKLGGSLVITAIALPVLTAMLEAVMNDIFAFVPGWLIMPVAFLVTLAVWLAVVWGLIKALFGKRAVDEAKGHVLAHGMLMAMRLVCTRPLAILASVVVLYLVWRLV